MQSATRSATDSKQTSAGPHVVVSPTSRTPMDFARKGGLFFCLPVDLRTHAKPFDLGTAGVVETTTYVRLTVVEHETRVVVEIPIDAN